jgi:hypothetical protein
VTRAGGTHADEMCNMYAMVYGRTPYLTMCDNDKQDIRDDSPGSLPRGGTLIADQTSTWAPPQPVGTPDDVMDEDGDATNVTTGGGAFGDATSVTTGPDGSLWVLYRCAAAGRGGRGRDEVGARLGMGAAG